MRVADGERQDDREDIGQPVFDRVGILRGEGHGSGELVVLFVDMLVDFRVVEGAVEGVEEDLAKGEGVDEIGGNLPKRGVRWADGVEGVLEIAGEVVDCDVEDG